MEDSRIVLSGNNIIKTMEKPAKAEKRIIKKTVFISCFLMLAAYGCSNTQTEYTSEINEEQQVKEEGTEEADKQQTSQIQEKESEIQMIYAQIGENILEISPENNSSAEALVKLLEESDITVDMREYGGFEKVGSLGSTLPTNDESITTEAGDVILYQGNQITIYYDKNTWNFTRLGRVQGISAKDLKDILGDGDVTVTFSLKK